MTAGRNVLRGRKRRFRYRNQPAYAMIRRRGKRATTDMAAIFAVLAH